MLICSMSILFVHEISSNNSILLGIGVLKFVSNFGTWMTNRNSMFMIIIFGSCIPWLKLVCYYTIIGCDLITNFVKERGSSMNVDWNTMMICVLYMIIEHDSNVECDDEHDLNGWTKENLRFCGNDWLSWEHELTE